MEDFWGVGRVLRPSGGRSKFGSSTCLCLPVFGGCLVRWELLGKVRFLYYCYYRCRSVYMGKGFIGGLGGLGGRRRLV